MSVTIDVIYEAGVLRPVDPLPGLRDHQRLTVTLHEIAPSHPLSALVGTMPDADAREMSQIIDAEFGKVDPNDWK